MQRNWTMGQFLSAGAAVLTSTFILLVIATLAMDAPLESTAADTPPTPAVLAEAPVPATPTIAPATVTPVPLSPTPLPSAIPTTPAPSPSPAATTLQAPPPPSPTPSPAQASEPTIETPSQTADPAPGSPTTEPPTERPAPPPATATPATVQRQGDEAAVIIATATTSAPNTPTVAAPAATPTATATAPQTGSSAPPPATPTTGPTVAPTTNVPPATATPTATTNITSLHGVLGFEINGDQPRLESINALSQGREAGPGFVRRNFIDWGAIEPTRGSYDFAATDQLLATLATVGAKPVVVVQGSPAWARPNATYTASGPIAREYLPDYGAFWKALVARYSQPPYNVKHWEIYNEPDNTKPEFEPFIGRFGETPEEYVAVLRTAYEAIKSTDPSATVLFGSLAYDFFDDSQDAGLVPVERSGGVFRRDFLDRTLALGAGQYFDGLGFHYYPEYDARWAARKPGLTGIAAKAEAIRDVLRKYHLDKPLYNSEIGFPSGQVPGVTGSEDLQARFLIQTFVRAASVNLRSVIWYRLVDDATPDTAKDFFSLHGLLGSTGQPKEAYRAFQHVQRVLGSASFVRKLSATEMGSDRIEGYLFRGADGKELRVLWATSEGNFSVTVPGAASLTVTQKDGTQRTITGSSVTVTSDPVFVVAG